jgi:hypothetical protein
MPPSTTSYSSLLSSPLGNSTPFHLQAPMAEKEIVIYRSDLKKIQSKEEALARVPVLDPKALAVISSVTPGFLKNKTRLIICAPRKSTHMSEWKSIRNNVII